VLVDMEGHSVAEVAVMLECAEGTVKSRCSRGRERLAVLLRDRLADTPGASRDRPHAEPRAGRARPIPVPPSPDPDPTPGEGGAPGPTRPTHRRPPRSPRYAASWPRPATTSRCRATSPPGWTTSSPSCAMSRCGETTS
jgi:RNA polymerase sigma-70 factor (ECF subfamily)